MVEFGARETCFTQIETLMTNTMGEGYVRSVRG